MSRERIRFIEHRGHRILSLDFTEMNAPGEALETFDRVRAVVASHQPASLLTLTDVTGTTYTGDVLRGLEELAAHNKPYVRAAASVTRTPLQLIAIRASAIHTRRKMMAFEEPEAAKEWLVQQAAVPAAGTV
jgi:hypothetical protein